MKKFIVIALGLAVSSCATTGAPNRIGDQYFMVGDGKCKRYTITNPKAISCYNSKGVLTDYRYAMTEFDMNVYIANMQYMNQLSRDMAAQIQRNNEEMSRITSQSLQNASSYTPPVTNPIGQSYVPTSCIRFGTGFTCSSPQDANNFVCTKAGPVYSCRQK